MKTRPAHFALLCYAAWTAFNKDDSPKLAWNCCSGGLGPGGPVVWWSGGLDLSSNFFGTDGVVIWWSAGLLVCWSAGMLVCSHAGLLVWDL